MAADHKAAQGRAPKKFILYVRCSTLEQQSDLQTRELIEYAERRGWLYEVYEDRASGTTASRKMLQKLLADARARKIDGVAVWKMDRLFRSLRHAVITLQELSDLGVDFYSHKDQIDMTTSAGRLLAHLLASFAEFEADLIRTRVTSGLMAARARGVKLGRPSVMTTDIEAQIVSLRFQDGLSLRQIQKRIGRVSKSSIERTLARAKAANRVPNTPLKKSPESEE